MAEVKYESKITKSIAQPENIFAVLSNMKCLNLVRDMIPQDKVSDIEIDKEYVRFKVDGLGQKVCIRIVDTEPGKTVKYGIENIPMEANMWIQLKQVADNDTRLKVTIKAELPAMFKMMLGSKLQDGVDRAAEMLAQMPFDNFSNLIEN